MVNVPYSIPITFKLQGVGFTSSFKNQTGNKSAENITFKSDLPPIQITGYDVPKEKVNPSKTDINRIQVSDYSYDRSASKVSGTVSDGSLPLPGVTIAVQGSNSGVISDFDGTFSIDAEKGDLITLQYIGLPTANLAITD